MFKKKNNNTEIPEEFTDESGNKWIQTSTEDIFSVNELNSILKSIEDDKNSGDIVLAQIDFKKVNREYYETLIKLQKELKQKTKMLDKLASESKRVVERKNKKLNELIEYIKKIHMLIALKKLDSETIEKIKIDAEAVLAPSSPSSEEDDHEISNVEAEEIELDENGEEII